jgi:cytochrome c biogenesis protein CcdA/thiol-disulfide isomerase/thioredoxin
MILLLTFAFLAGAATAITPCVLPVLPALLSASGTGGRRRPVGIVTGLTLTHVITIVGVASVVDGVGVGDGALRTVAICVLALFGITLLVPRAAEWLTLRMSFLQRLAPRGDADGFWSGLPVGGALGFVYAPCAGPILAAVISVSASSGTTAKIVAVAIAYGLGSAAVLLGLALGGRRVIDRVRRSGRGGALQRGFGAVMLLTAVLMFTSVDLRFQEALASHFPSFLTNPTGGLEKSAAVEDQLAGLRGKSKFGGGGARHEDEKVVQALAVAAARGHAALPGVKTPELAVLGEAPEFASPAQPRWLNSPPLTMAGLRGRVVLVDFWTYTCINCLRTLPYVKAWDARYRAQGLTIVGVHTPEFDFEKKTSNVRAAIGRQGIRYPVLQDDEYGTWNAFGNQYWPAKYLIDARGRVRYVHFGEGDYKQTEAAIRALLAEAGDRRLGAAAAPHGPIETVGRRATPETYLGSARAQSFSPVGPKDGTHDYTAAAPGRLQQSVFSLGGRWHVDREAARAVRGATITARVVGGAVYLVLSSQGDRPRRVRVELDGRPISRAAAGDDVRGGAVTVRRQRLYSLVKLRTPGEHVLELRLDAGVSGYAFTFG